MAKRAGELGSETAKFGWETGKEAAPAAITGMAGRLVNVPLAAAQVSSGISGVQKTVEIAKKGDVSGAIKTGAQSLVDLGLGLYSAKGAIRDKGWIVSESIKNMGIKTPKQVEMSKSEAAKIMEEVVRPEKGEIRKFEIKNDKNLGEIFQTMAEEKLVPEVDVNNKMDWTKSIDDQFYKVEVDGKELNSRLASKPHQSTVNMEKVRSESIGKLDEITMSSTEKKEAINTINEIINDEIEFKGSNPHVSEANKIKQGLWKTGYRADKPMSSRMSRIVGHFMADQIDVAAKDPYITHLNRQIGRRMDMISLMGNATGRVVKGGRLGDYFVGFVMSKALDWIPGVGPLVGYAAGKSASSALNKVSPIMAAKRAGRKANVRTPAITPEFMGKMK
jgi:hypothetical protein